ncbi:MAG TPA: hypothetical protein VD997_12475 [Phycisphaerales bacterium]|nr:hypothetical protein [Phycisphaerales bacterium]
MRPRRDSFPPTSRDGGGARPGADDRIGGQPEAQGWTKAELLEACDLSPKSFDTLRKAARVRGPSHGGLNWVFSRADVEALIHRAESGKFTEMGPTAAAAWKKLLNGE